MNKTKSIQTEIITISPKSAIKILESNENNRSVRDRHVKALAREMKAGRWKLNGESIKMSNNRLVDGQHRLFACIESGVSFKTVLIKNVDDDVFDTIDCGSRRSAGDTLGIYGEKSAKQLSACLKLLDQYKEGKVLQRQGYTNQETLYLVRKYPNARESVRFAMTMKGGFISVSIIATCHYIFSELDSEHAYTFLKRVIKGTGLIGTEPEYALREKILSSKTRGLTIQRSAMFAMIVRAWNHCRIGTVGKDVRVIPESEMQDFPEAL